MDRRDFLVTAMSAGLELSRAPHASAAGLSKARATLGPDFITALKPPVRGLNIYEPHIAIDPANPNRIAVAAQYGIKGGRAGRNLQLWVSEDGGRSWISTRVSRPKFDGEFTADPIVAFSTDGSVLVAGDCARREIADFNDASSFSRQSAPPYPVAAAGGGAKFPSDPDILNTAKIAVSRSEDGGRTMTSTAMSGVSPGADKPAVAVDRNPSSRFYGSVYVSWWDKIPSLRVARSTDGGRTFASPVMLKTWAAAYQQQMVIRPDGAVHLMWSLGGAPGFKGAVAASAGAPPDAGSLIYHTVSTDGGITFSTPTTVARNAGVGMIGIPTVAVDRRGRLLFVWGQAGALPDMEARPVVQPRHRLHAIRSDDGIKWSAPFELCPWQPPNTHMGLPALTSDGYAWWLLTYFADDEETQVLLLRSDHSGARFRLDRVLATRAIRFQRDRMLAKRPIPVDEISLMGAHLLRYCDDIPQIGDYVGIDAVGSRVAAAIVLPESEEPMSTSTVYVTVTDAR